MNDLISTLVWCTLQVSLLSLIGVTVAALIARRSAPLACSVLFSAASVAALLTAMAPLPIHGLFAIDLRHDNPVSLSDRTHVPESPLKSGSSFTAKSSVSEQNLGLDPVSMLTALQSVAKGVRTFEQQHRPIIHGTSLLLLAIISLGFLRLFAEMRYVLRTRQSSIPVDSPSVLNDVKSALVALQCSTIPEVRVHREFNDAAVIGWLRPMLILPHDWKQWNACEQRAVITHEVAHIVRHDAPWRLMASCVLAMHFYNPIIHWLLRRAVLYQELSTDQMAADLIGRQDYLRSLSSLAIRRDDQWGRNVSTRVLPVFSGHLIRRIKVLHSKEGIRAMNRRRGHTVTSAFISAAFLAAGLAAIATRGIAQSPPDKAKPKLTLLPASIKRNLNLRLSNPTPTNEMFHRGPIDPKVVGSSNPYGMAVLRVRELLAKPEIQPHCGLLNAWISEQLKTALHLKTAPAIRADGIEWIAARPCLTTKTAPNSTKSSIMFGAGGFVFKLSHELDLRAWLEEDAPGIKRYALQGDHPGQTVDVYEVTSALAGPIPIQFWMKDSTTLQICSRGTSIESLTKLSDMDLSPQRMESRDGVKITNNLVNQHETTEWSAVWNRIDCGLGSVLLPKCDNSGLLADFKNHPDFQTTSNQLMGRLYEELCSLCRMTGVSFDFGGENHRIGIRVSLIHSSVESAHRSETIVRELLPLLLSEYERRSLELNRGRQHHDMAKKQVELLTAMFSAAVYTVSQPEQDSAELLITTEFPLAKFEGLSF